MRFTTLLSMFVFLCACGDNADGNGGGGTDGGVTVDSSVDAPPAPAMITISGVATRREGATPVPAEGVMVGAYQRSNPDTPVATTTTDADGMYSLVIETGGVAVDGFLKATLADHLDTYLYPPRPLTGDYDGASLNMVNADTVTILFALCQELQDDEKAIIGLLVRDSDENPVEGAKATSTPAPGFDCYNAGDYPNGMARMTDASGISYLLNVEPGEVTVSAMKTGITFQSHRVTARVGALTTTVVEP